ncbi:hypothetical protein HU742_005335 [Pseudomonas sp. SWRI102]|uniref:Uncharacterized protein n=1 Tax=Pseudomonas marvdashtae TaxID=2745500 RepID=A0A923JQZ9_9PSED|nr:hypothetical protein [Pseudomonas marvdashtae]MBV4550568.1 hypothetical protein [Pseudomonas marvdashtae]
MNTDDEIEEIEPYDSKNQEPVSNATLRIISPSGYIPERSFVVSGDGAVKQGLSLIELFTTAGKRFGTAPIDNDGSWRNRVEMPTGIEELVYFAHQTSYGTSARKAVNRHPTTLLEPQSDVSLRPDQVIFRGDCFPEDGFDPGMRIRVLEGNNVLASVTVRGGSPAIISRVPWEARPLAQLSIKTYTVRAEYKSSSSEILTFTENLTFSVIGLDQVVITPVTTPQEMDFILTGTRGLEGASVEVKIDLRDVKVGEGHVVAGGAWSATVKMPEAGPTSLVAIQTYQNVPSPASAARPFKIKPPRLVDISTGYLPPDTLTFSGGGYTGATVEISIISGPPGATPPSPKIVVNGTWETTATNWPFGTYSLKAIQKVSDNANGWIESQPYTFALDRGLPDVSDVIYTQHYQPTISGKGVTGARVKLADPGGASEAAPPVDVRNGAWSSQVKEVWGPTFKREVHIQQSLNGQSSPDWYKLEITIAPLAPVMDSPVENGLSPNLSGTCWPGASLKLKYSDSNTEHPVTNNNGRWTFRRETPFAPDITHTATLIQHAASQDSPPASRTFTVSVPMRKPEITHPSPGEVGRDVTIRGRNGMSGASMQLRDAQFGRLLGAPKLLTTDGEWFINLAGLDFREYTLDAQQTLDGRPSERSAHLVLTVVLLPPQFDVPQPGGKLPRTAELSGNGMPNGRVNVWLQGQAEPLLEEVPVNSGGNWKRIVTLPVGQTTIRAKQFFKDEKGKDQESEYGPWLAYNVVPAAPFIETPAAAEHIGRRVVVSGFGVPGDTVTVRLDDSELKILGRSPVLEDRTWSVTVTLDQPGGAHGLVAVAEYDEFESDDSQPRAVVLGTYLPSIDVPTTGRWIDNPVGFEGQGRPGVGQVVSWYNPDRAWAANLAVDAGAWRGEAVLSLPSGGHWCRFKQTLTDSAGDGTVSDWVESERFDVLPPSSQP